MLDTHFGCRKEARRARKVWENRRRGRCLYVGLLGVRLDVLIWERDLHEVASFLHFKEPD